MDEYKSKFFSVEDLSFKPYGLLMTSLFLFNGIKIELELLLNKIQIIEIEHGYLNHETLNDKNLIIEELNCLCQNIKILTDVMKCQEDKAFFKVNALPFLCLN